MLEPYMYGMYYFSYVWRLMGHPVYICIQGGTDITEPKSLVDDH